MFTFPQYSCVPNHRHTVHTDTAASLPLCVRAVSPNSDLDAVLMNQWMVYFKSETITPTFNQCDFQINGHLQRFTEMARWHNDYCHEEQFSGLTRISWTATWLWVEGTNSESPEKLPLFLLSCLYVMYVCLWTSYRPHHLTHLKI